MTPEETKAYLARIRKTISESEAVLEQAERRIAETDELLEGYGITREQLRKMRPTEEQMELVNEELRFRGLEPVEPIEEDAYLELGRRAEPNVTPEFETGEDELENRKRKFSTMMQNYRI